MSESHSVHLPSFNELPSYKNFTGCAWKVWEGHGYLGTVSMLTPEVVARAAREEIQSVEPFSTTGMGTYTINRSGKSISLNWCVTANVLVVQYQSEVTPIQAD